MSQCLSEKKKKNKASLDTFSMECFGELKDYVSVALSIVTRPSAQWKVFFSKLKIHLKGNIWGFIDIYDILASHPIKRGISKVLLPMLNLLE